MKNNGLFSTLFLEELKKEIQLDDAAEGRLATLAQTWRSRDSKDIDSLWDSFLKQALSYLEFVPPKNSSHGVYPLYEDWSYENCISTLYLAPPGSDINNTSVGSFYPAKLIAQLKKRDLSWGILTNGAIWRLYSTKSSRPYEDYVELRLDQTLGNSDEAEYGLFERFFHQDSFTIKEEKESKQNNESEYMRKCRLDLDRNRSEKVLDDKVKTPLLTQIDEVLQYICNGFIFDTKKSGEEYTEEERSEIFESAVKLIYRCLFLFYAEARRLLPTDPEKKNLYKKHSIKAVCGEARKFKWGNRYDTNQYDLWKHLKGLISAVNDGDPEYGIMGYNGGLFDDEEEKFLGQHQLRNDFLSRALYLLAFVEPVSKEESEEYRIPYEDLEVRHLGELYENILEYKVLLADADRIRRRTKKGVEILLASQTTKKADDTYIKKGEVYFGESALERKQTGSYYTPESLVRFLNEKTIIQPLSQNFENDYRKRFNELLEQARKGHDFGTRRGAAQSAVALIDRFVKEMVLNFKICDPAMGSGHFLVDATNQMAGLVVSLMEEIPYIEGMTVSVNSRPNDWRRLITRHCIYGVDINPLAVNLAKLSLWLNCFAGEHRLTFLDHHIRCGNSLIGIRSLDQLKAIPKRKKDKKKKDVQRLLFDFDDLSYVLSEASGEIESIQQIDEDDTDRQKEILDTVHESTKYLSPIADLYTAYLMDSKIQPDIYKDIFEALVKDKPIGNSENSWHTEFLESIKLYSKRHHFFHWPIEFPDIFSHDPEKGFSATVGNPPWDIVKPNSQEFFSNYEPKFRSYNKQQANKISQELMANNPAIDEKWREYRNRLVEQSLYFKEPSSFNAQGKGDINTYKLFLEQFFYLLNEQGRMGIVVPSGLYTDQGCLPLRKMFFYRSQINYLYSFENRWPAVFTAVDGRFKFVLFGIQKGGKTDQFKCAFMEHDPARLPLIHDNALKMSVKQVKKFSPDTLSIMEFESQRDFAVTKKIYNDHPLLGEYVNDAWQIILSREIQDNAANYLSNDPSKGKPLVEGKWIHQYDYAFSKPTLFFNDRAYSALANADEFISDRRLKYKTGIRLNTSEYRFVCRRQAASTNERTIISTVIQPGDLCGDNLEVSKIFDNTGKRLLTDKEVLLSVCFLNSFVIDYIVRNKISTNLNKFYFYQLPLLRTRSKISKLNPLLPRAARLICTSYDFSNLWQNVYSVDWRMPDYFYSSKTPIDTYGPIHEQNIRKRLRDEAHNLTPEWTPLCGVHDRLPDRRDTGDRAQLRAEIDAYVAHLYGLSQDDFAYILDTFPVLKKKEEKAFGEFMSKRKCLEEYDRISLILEKNEMYKEEE
jgi:hypothetical protein